MLFGMVCVSMDVCRWVCVWYVGVCGCVGVGVWVCVVGVGVCVLVFMSRRLCVGFTADVYMYR